MIIIYIFKFFSKIVCIIIIIIIIHVIHIANWAGLWKVSDRRRKEWEKVLCVHIWLRQWWKCRDEIPDRWRAAGLSHQTLHSLTYSANASVLHSSINACRLIKASYYSLKTAAGYHLCTVQLLLVFLFDSRDLLMMFEGFAWSRWIYLVYLDEEMALNPSRLALASEWWTL